MNTLYAIRHCPCSRIGPSNLFPILQMRLKITGCRLFCAPESLFTPSPHPAGHSVCYTTVPPSPNWPQAFISNFTNATEYYRLHAVLSTGKSIHPIQSSRGTQHEHSVCHTTVPPSL